MAHPPEHPGVVLITGCSSGIGAACAEAFLAARWTTIATARRLESLDSLARRGAVVAELDVTSDVQRREVVAELLARHGRIDVLVNNAGYPEYGPLEEVDLDRWRTQFETNVFSVVALSQLVIPAMRERGHGRIINLSSMGGVITLPLGSAYHASKWAVEAISDVARFELAPFGIKVVVIQPGVVLSNFETTAQHGLVVGPNSPYANLAARFASLVRNSYAKKSSSNLSPQAVAEVIVRAATVPRPRTRYTLPLAAKLFVTVRPILPDRLYDLLQRSQIR